MSEEQAKFWTLDELRAVKAKPVQLSMFGEQKEPASVTVRQTGVRCLVCNRPLKNPHSVIRKVGPVCMGKAVKILKKGRLERHGLT